MPKWTCKTVSGEFLHLPKPHAFYVDIGEQIKILYFFFNNVEPRIDLFRYLFQHTFKTRSD